MSERTILSTFGTEASACRDALDLAEYTRAMLCEVLIGERVLPDESSEEHLPIGLITDCKSLFDCLAKDASVLEERGTALTVASLREKVFGRSGTRHKTIGFDVGADTSAVGGRTDKIICWSLLEKCSNIWNRSTSRREYESLEAEPTHWQSDRVRDVSVAQVDL